MNRAWMSLALAGLGWKLLATPVTMAVVDETEGASVKNCAPDIVALGLAGESSLSAEYRRLTAEKYAVAKLPASAALKQAILYRGSRWAEVATGVHQFGHADEGFSWAVLEEKSSGDKVLAFVVRAAADMAAADAVRQERLRQLHRAVDVMAQSHGAAIVGGGHFGPYGDSPAIRQLQAAGWLDAQQAEPTAEVTPTLTRVFFDPRRIESYEFRLGRPAAAKPETDLRPAIFTFRLHEERAWAPPVVGVRPTAAKWLKRIAAGEFDDVSSVGEVEYQPADEGTVIDIVVDTRAVLEALRYRRPELKVALRPLASKDAARAQAANAELVKYVDGRRVRATGFAPSYPKTYARTEVSGSRGKWWWVDRLRANRDRIAREGGEYDVVMLGDSVTHFWHDFDYWTGARPGWERMQQEFRLLNLGYGGDNTRNLLWRLRHGELDGYRTKVFQLLIGANNYRDRPEVTAKEIGEIVQLLRERHPEAKIALMALLPRDDRPEFHALNLQVNERIKKYADDRTVFFLDIGQVFLGPDGHFKPGLSPDNDKLHLRGWGYELWWQQVAPTYRRWCSLLPGYEQAKIVCAKPGGWEFATTSREPEPGVVELDIELKSPVAAPPPAFDLEYELPGVGADHVWSAFDDRYMLYASGFDGRTRYTSQLAYQTPVLTVFGDEGSNVLAVACSEALRKVRFGVGISERTCTLQGTFKFFTEAEPATNAYRLSVRLDRRRNFWATAVTAASDWVMAVNGFQPCAVPEAAFDPLYSTWYAYWQDVDAAELEREFPLAAALGMRTAILDDGWQKVQSASWYSATGDWQPVKSRFPDLKAHVAKAHAAGLKYMLWLSVPYVGDEAAAWKRFQGKFLRIKGTESPGRVGVLDPRFPEVREYLIQTYERVVRDWGFDGLKLDFIDQFVIEGEDPAAAEAYRGRDYRSLPEAVDRLMREVVARLTAIRPEVLIEFRQHYMGPAIRQYGNMIRATDSPADSDRIRKQIADLRLTSGTAAVHADMLVWHPEETPERAARPILNSLFSVIQYSMVLSRLPEAHRQVVRHWIEFTQRHREALVRGTFRPYHPELLYPRLEGESATEKVIALYSVAQPVAVDAAAKRTVLVNATFDPEIPVVAAGSARARVFDVIGREQGIVELATGIQLLRIPVSGYAEFEVSGEVGKVPAVVSASAVRECASLWTFAADLWYNASL